MHREIFPLLFVLGAMGCNQATLTEPVDAAEDGAACVAHAVEFCDASPGGCVGGGADPNVSLLPSDASFPVGCSANVIGTDRDPISGVCKLAATCSCEGDDAGDAAAWVCH